MAKILIVDDERPVREVLRRMLTNANHEVTEATEGNEAVALFTAERPDLVITDILMPNKGGLVAIREIRAVDPQAPIIAISGGGRTGRLSFLSTARTFRGVRTLEKPFRRKEIMDLVEEMLQPAAEEAISG